MHLEQILAYFKGAKPGSNGNVMVTCPAHDDGRQSLSITERNNTILMKCMAGCPTKLVVEKAGLKMADLMNGKKSPIIATYDYTDEEGTLLFQVCRKSDKSFSQRRPNGKGGWIWNMEGVRKVPYHLPRLLAATETIFIVEGEKDVIRLMNEGFTATTNPGGAGKWREEYSPYFGNKKVVIIPDNDGPGKSHAADIQKFIPHAQILELPDLPEKGDVSDWLDVHPATDLLNLISTQVYLAIPYEPNSCELKYLTATLKALELPISLIELQDNQYRIKNYEIPN